MIWAATGINAVSNPLDRSSRNPLILVSDERSTTARKTMGRRSQCRSIASRLGYSPNAGNAQIEAHGPEARSQTANPKVVSVRKRKPELFAACIRLV